MTNIITTLIVCAVISPIVSYVGDVYVVFQFNGVIFSANTRTLCVLSKDERFKLSSTIQTKEPFPPNTNMSKIFHITTSKCLLGVRVTDAERWVLEVMWSRNNAGKQISLYTWFVEGFQAPCTRDELTNKLLEASNEYLSDITGFYQRYLKDREERYHRRELEIRSFEPYEDVVVETPVYDDGTFCMELPDPEPNFDVVAENDGSCPIPDDEPDFARIPENDGSFEQVNTGERITLQTGQVLVQVKYRGRTKYVLLDENYVDENTTLPTIIGDLERNLLHLGVNATSDRLQRMMLFRLDFLQGKTSSEIAESYSIPYHIVYNDLQVIRKIKWPDGLVI